MVLIVKNDRMKSICLNGFICSESDEKICKIVVVLKEDGFFEKIHLLLLDETIPLEENAMPLKDSPVAELILSQYHENEAVIPHKPLGSTDFTQTVYKKLFSIPFGRKVTYQELAKECGNEKAARAVGNAMRINPLPIIYPCHRVVGKDGLRGFVGKNPEYLKIKEKLLDMENRGERIRIM